MRTTTRGVKRRSQIRQEYFDWMVCHIRGNANESLHCLLSLLHETAFTYILDMDKNRAVDGRNLRYRFGCEQQYEREEIQDLLDDRPCSVLEMMAALAIRCEEHIMTDSDYGDRTGNWFYTMIESLGLSDMTDEHFDYIRAKAIIDRFLDREYDPDGRGGLFILQHPRSDLRRVEIWYQAMWYLSEIERM